MSQFNENQSHLDTSFKEHRNFSVRVINALMRSGIFTPRILLMHTSEYLLHNVRNLSSKGFDELQVVLKDHDWQLPEQANEDLLKLIRRINLAMCDTNTPLSFDEINKRIHRTERTLWSEAAVREGIKLHPYVTQVGNDRFHYNTSSVEDARSIAVEQTEPAKTIDHKQTDVILNQEDINQNDRDLLSSSNDSTVNSVNEQGQIILEKIWSEWIKSLDKRTAAILITLYGVEGEEPPTLQELGDTLSLTRERVRQIRARGVNRSKAFIVKPIAAPLVRLFTRAIQTNSNILTESMWERLLDQEVIWITDKPRLQLFPLLCQVVIGYHYLDQYNIATIPSITNEHLGQLEKALKQALSPFRKEGLPINELIVKLEMILPAELPAEAQTTEFIIQAIECNLFDKIERRPDMRFYYVRKKKKALYPSANSSWLGMPGTQLYQWETELRAKFENVAWIGQIRFSKDDFDTMHQAIKNEAQSPNYFTKEAEGQPRLVPPAVFVTSMVMSARYASQGEDEAVDEFWTPYLRDVWDMKYSQAFYVRCKKRFHAAAQYLQDEFGFEFPQPGNRQGDVVTPIFRHALIPQYMQSDFCLWLRKNWQHVLVIAETPELLVANLQTERSLDHYYSHRLKDFVTGKATFSTAAALITNLAAAISLHVDDGESVESISELLIDSPIEQELWNEIASEFNQPAIKQSEIARRHKPLEQELLHEIASEFNQPAIKQSEIVRHRKPRVNWIWSINDGEMGIRIQNIAVSVNEQLDGELDRIVWVESEDDCPEDAEIEIEVTPWRTRIGEQLIHEVMILGEDGPLDGCLYIMTDMDEIVTSLDIPAMSLSNILFFRAVKQGAFGIPVDPSQIGDGVWFVCAKQPLEFFDDENEIVEPQAELLVPYPLDENYCWAAQVEITLPVTILHNEQKLITLEAKEEQSLISEPILVGQSPIANLSDNVQQSFTDKHISLEFKHGGRKLLKQAALWIQGADGWRCQQQISELYHERLVTVVDDMLSIQLFDVLPEYANVYTVELRAGLQSILSMPLHFAIVPDIKIEYLNECETYSPASPFQIEISGIDKSCIVYRSGIKGESINDAIYQITWTDLRNEPRLVIRINNVDIPLAWSISRFMAWLEPKSERSFLTMQDLSQSRLNVVGTGLRENNFAVDIPGVGTRLAKLKRGKYSAQVSQLPIYDMIRLARHPEIKLQIGYGSNRWKLADIRRQPSFTDVSVEHNPNEQTILFTVNLANPWSGQCRFLVESLSNPFMTIKQLDQTESLNDIHLFPTKLDDGLYALRLEIDGAKIDMDETSVQFVVGNVNADIVQSRQIGDEIRSGQLISTHLADDVLLCFIEAADNGSIELTQKILYQLATLPTSMLDYFSKDHLVKLWPPLSSLKDVHHETEWVEENGHIPAWILLSDPIVLKIDEHGFRLPVIPTYAMAGGYRGKGIGHWRLSSEKDSPKEIVYVQWRQVAGIQVHVEAGLPANDQNGINKIDILDTFGLHFCTRCGRLTGAEGYNLPDSIIMAHLHGRSTAELYDITYPEEHGGYRLMAEFYPDRLGPSLLDAYEEHQISIIEPEVYLAEPPKPQLDDYFEQPETRAQLVSIIRELGRVDSSHTNLSPRATVARVLNRWSQTQNVSTFGQTVFALCVLARTAAYDRRRYFLLLRQAHLSESSIKNLIYELNKQAQPHLVWGLIWAELLMRHSPKKSQ